MGRKNILANNLIILSGLMLALAVISWAYGQQSRIVIEWSTASELNTAGFNIYRGLSPDQIDQKINPVIIPGSTDPLSGGEYQYYDETVESGKLYYYLIEEVDHNGAKTQYGPISIKANNQQILAVYLPVILLVFGVIAIFTGYFLGRKNTMIRNGTPG